MPRLGRRRRLRDPGQSGGVPRIASTSLALPAFIQLVRKPKGVMPPFGSDRASDSDLADVHAYLQSLKTPAKQESAVAVNPSNGQRLFVKDGCYECHGYLGQGSTSTGGTRLGPPADSAFRLRQLRTRTNRPDAALYCENDFQRRSRRDLQFPEIRSATAVSKNYSNSESVIFRVLS